MENFITMKKISVFQNTGSKNLLKGNKKNYQMDFRNSDEAIREVALDIKEEQIW